MKKILIAVILTAVFFISSVSAYATGGWQGWHRGHVPQLIYAGPTVIRVDFDSVTVAPDNPVCPGVTFVSFVVNQDTIEYKRLLAMLMMAKTTRSTIGFAANGVCDTGNGSMGTGGPEVFVDL